MGKHTIKMRRRRFMTKRPLIITIIGYFYIFGAIVLMISLPTTQEIPFNIRFNVPAIPETVIKITLILFALILSYGYLKLKKWGFWAMTVYSILFACISATQISAYKSQPFIGNLTFSLFVLVVTLLLRHKFIET